MAQGTDIRIVQRHDKESGEILPDIITGFVMTYKGKYEIMIEDFEGRSNDPLNKNTPTHILKVRAVYGEFIEAGRAWLKVKGEGKNKLEYFSVSMRDPEALQFALFAIEDSPGEYRAAFN